MKNKSLLFRLFAVVAAMMCALGIQAQEAYSCYTPSNTTLTFYYDNQRSSRTGTTYDLNTGSNDTGWDTDGTKDYVTTVVFDPSFANARPTTTYDWFYGMHNLQSITGIFYLNTSDVTNMGYMFNHCSGLTSLDVSGFDTHNVTNMCAMFQFCSSLISLDMSGFNTVNVTNMSCMFNKCQGLTNLDLSNFNTDNVTDMDAMFNGCKGLTSLDLSNFNTANVIDMGYLFEDCSALTSLNLSSFNTANVTDMSNMFDECGDLSTIYVGENWSTAAVTQSEYMFMDCFNLVGGQGTSYNASNPKNKTYAHIDGGPSNPGYFTRDPNAPIPPTAYACYTSSNTTLTFYYDNQRSSRTGTTYSLSSGNSIPGWISDGTNANVTKVVFDPSFANARPTTTYVWFDEMSNLQSITGLSYLNTNKVTNMRSMFYGCSGLTSLDLSSFDTQKVSDMRHIFSGCTSLTSLDLSSFNTQNVTNMGWMFDGCSGLTGLDLSSFNTHNVTDMNNMFYSCSNVTTIFVNEDWTTDAVTSSGYMFTGCTNLVGGMGTTYDVNHADKTYARIDGGPSNPGYFSRLLYVYGINVGGVVVSEQNAADITGASITDGSVSFDPATHVLTLTDATITCSTAPGIQVTTDYVFDDLTIRLVGNNTINTTSYTPVALRCQSTITGPGSLTVKVNGYNGYIDMIGDHPLIIEGGCTIYGSSISGSNSAATLKARGTDTEINLSSCIFGFGSVTLEDGLGYVKPEGGSYDTNIRYTVDSYGDKWTNGVIIKILPYACYTEDNTTLTFYCDSQRNSRPGAKFNLNEGNEMPKWYNEGYYEDITQVVFDPSFAVARPTSTYCWFDEMYNLTSIEGIDYLNTSEVTSMAYMFSYCESLTSLDLSHFDTGNVTNMDYMFYECSSLTSLDLSGFNTENVKSFKEMFFDCVGLNSMDLRHFDTRNAESMNGMFLECSGLTSLDLSSFNTAKVTDMGYMFDFCRNLQTIYVGNDWSTAAVTNSSGMFSDCLSIVGGKGTTYDSNHIDKAYAHIDGGTSNPGYFTEKGPEPYACYTSSNTTLTFYYDNYRSSRTGTTYDLNTGTNDPGWYSDGTNANVTKVDFSSSFAAARPTSAQRWFSRMENLTSITGLNYLNTSEVTNMLAMFFSCNKLTSLDLSCFNTAKVTSMNFMFQYCYGLTSINLSSFNTANVTKMNFMFQYCSGLTSLDLSNFNTANVTLTNNMFQGCTNLTTIYAGSGWTTNAVTSSGGMFTGCTSIVGGKGTTYDSNHTDKAYAHVDGGPSNPGYFTDKNASLRGDVNGDTHVSIADVTALIDYLLSHDASSINVDAADCNQDTNVSISDVTALIDYLLSGSW